MLRFKVLSGIGDISWVYSKCLELTKKREIGFVICNDAPPRSAPFVDLLPRITNLGYGDFSASSGFGDLLPPDTDLSRLADGTYTVSVNPYLESGMRLHEIFPKQKTHYHYEFAIRDADKDRAKTILSEGKTHPFIGFYASSYNHSAERGFWNYDEWAIFLREIALLYPTATFFALGAAYDNKTQDVLHTIRQSGLTAVDAMNLDIGATIEVIRGLDYLFAFPSGLGILADVVQTPCMMWYFNNFADPFINTYPDPEHVASGKHINLLYHKVPEALTCFKERGAPWVRRPIPRKALLQALFLRGQAGGRTAA
jgi:hypothetical protein